MKKIIIILSFLSLSISVLATELNVKITSLTNVRGNGAMEVCGFVTNQKKITSLVTIKHDKSSYTTLTDEAGKWCQVIKRWNFNGDTEANARKLL